MKDIGVGESVSCVVPARELLLPLVLRLAIGRLYTLGIASCLIYDLRMMNHGEDACKGLGRVFLIP